MVIGIFLDLKKAFDTVNHTILVKKLYSYGIRGQFINWFKSYLENRSQNVTYNEKRSDIKDVVCGVPQGSILGPLLFLIYINDFASVSIKLYYDLFAYDTNVFISGNNLRKLINTLHIELDKLYAWLQSNKLILNLLKIHYMVFHLLDLRAKLLVACKFTPAIWLNLSDSRNILIIHFIIHYYREQFDLHKTDLKKSWNIIKSIISKEDNRHSEKHTCFLINNQYISDSKIIAYTFNNYFVHVGSSLAKNIQTETNPLPYFESIENNIHNPEINMDEVRTILSAIKNISQILNTELENVNIWLKANKLTVNIKETQYMMFHRTRIKLNTNFKILINSNIIDNTNNTKFPGVIIDNKMN